jgi:predicted DNA-binding ribbon-helix-helix protein
MAGIQGKLGARSLMNRRNDRKSDHIPKRSIVLSGYKTSVTLEEPFWQALRELATVRGLSVSSLIRSVASERGQGNLSSALRVFVLEHFRTAAYERDALGGPSG